MASPLTGQDAYGPWIDTGSAVQPAARANVTTEQHIGQTVIDTGSTLTAAQITASHIPQRSATCTAMTDAERIERLEDAMTLLLAERYGDPSTDLSGLRQVVREQQHRLATEVVERMRARAADTTGMAQYTGENVPAIKEFLGSAATVSEDPELRGHLARPERQLAAHPRRSVALERCRYRPCLSQPTTRGIPEHRMRQEDRGGPVLPDIDPHRAAAQQRLRAIIGDVLPMDADRHHNEYQQKRDAARLAVAQNEQIRALGGDPPELPDSVVKLARTPSGNESVERILGQIHESRRQALAEALASPRGATDGSSPAQTQAGWEALEAANFARQRGYPQMTAHQRLAEGYAPPGDADRHAADRAAREALYRRKGPKR